MSGMVFEGREGVNLYVAATLKSALKLYANTGMKVNRAYTPKAMMAKAAELTGKTFKARDYMGAVDALQEMIDSADKSSVKTF